MFCKKCGKEIENDSLFCKYCGTSLQEEIINIIVRNSFTNREKTICIAKNATYNDLLDKLIENNLLPNETNAISTCTILNLTTDREECIRSNGGFSRNDYIEFNDDPLDDCFVDGFRIRLWYKETKREYFHSPSRSNYNGFGFGGYDGFKCLYGCPMSNNIKNEATTFSMNNVEIVEE